MNLRSLILLSIFCVEFKVHFADCKFDYLNEIFRFKNYSENNYLLDKEMSSCCSNKNF